MFSRNTIVSSYQHSKYVISFIKQHTHRISPIFGCSFRIPNDDDTNRIHRRMSLNSRNLSFDELSDIGAMYTDQQNIIIFQKI